MQLKENVYVETGFQGANVGFVVTAGGIVMIDTPHHPTDAVKWRDEIKSKGVVKYLINTEPHVDHFTGNFFFDVPVIAQEKVRESILSADTKMVLDIISWKDPEGISLVKEYKVNVPSITFPDRMSLYLGKHSFHLINLPGHTVGETAVYIPEEKVVFTGDNVFAKVQSFFQEADPFAWLESLKSIGQLEVDYIIPGHGGVCDKSFLKEQADYIQECLETIKNAIDQGLTKEETMAKVSLPQRYPIEYGTEKVAEMDLLPRSISNLYDILSR